MSADPPQGRLIASAATAAGGKVEVYENRESRWMRFNGPGQVLQSQMALALPEQPCSSYVRSMLAALLFVERPASILNLGMGGGALERFFLSHMSELALKSVESEPVVIEMAKRYFQLPREFPVVNLSADLFLAEDSGCYDILFCDIYEQAGHPGFMFGERFYADIRNRISTRGLLVINVLARSEAEMLQLLLSIRQSLPWVSLLEFEGLRNILLFAGCQPPPDVAALEHRAERLCGSMRIDLRGVGSGMRRLPPRP